MRLICPTATKIVIVKAIYGRDKYSSSCGDFFYDGDCTERNKTEAKLRSLCSNNQNCSIYVGSANFQDPCPLDIKKLLKVWYQCVGDGMCFIEIIYFI
jgi:hypothetical protein